MHSPGADVKLPKPATAASQPLLEWGRELLVMLRELLVMLRAGMLLVALSGVTAGVLWLRKEMPQPRLAMASRVGTLVEARSLSGLLQPVATPQMVSFAARKGPANAVVNAAPSGRAGEAEAPIEWPREVALKETPTVGEVFQDPKTKAFIYRTKHFEFSGDMPLGPEVVGHLARPFEATHLLNCLLPLDLKPLPEPTRKLFRVCLLSTTAAYMGAGGKPGSGGFYSRNDKCLYVRMSTLGMKMDGKRVVLDRSLESHGTLVREITQQMMNRWQPLLPVWLAEGTVEYVGAAEFAQGRFLLGQMQDRLKGRLRNGGSRQMESNRVQLAMLGVPEMLGMTPKTWAAGLATAAEAENHVSALLLTFYLYHLDRGGEGKGTIALLRAVEKGMPHEEAVREFILAGRTPAQLEEEMGAAFAELGVELRFTRRGGKMFAQQ